MSGVGRRVFVYPEGRATVRGGLPPEKVLVSYASRRLVGALLDIEHEKVVEANACAEARSDDMDVLGRVGIEDLIEICSAADQRAFDALWRTHVTAARAAAVARGERPCVPEDDSPPTGPTTSTSPRPALRFTPATGRRGLIASAWCRTRRPIP